jgi:glutamate 5-kinase
MLTKVLAARRAARSGAHTVIASGREEDVLLRLARGERLGTLLTASTLPIAAKKQWLADHLTVGGRLTRAAMSTRLTVVGGRRAPPGGPWQQRPPRRPRRACWP